MSHTYVQHLQSLGHNFSDVFHADEDYTGWPAANTNSVSRVYTRTHFMPPIQTHATIDRSAFYRTIKRSICGHIDLYYYSDIYMSRCVEELQELYQFIDVSTQNSDSSLTQKTNSWWRHLVAGGLAGAVSRTTTAPLDRLKVFLMVYGTKNNNLKMASAFKNMLLEGGVASLWRGNGMNVTKVMPEMALKFMAYEQIKSHLKFGSNRELSIFERFASGSLAGVISQTAIYPLEVIKTRLAIRKTGQYKGIYDCSKNILKHHGIRGFYRGYVPNIIGIIPYAGIDLAVYETLKRTYINQQSSTEHPGAQILVACAVISSTCGQLVSYPLALVRTRLQAHEVVVAGSCDTVAGLVKTIVKTDGARGLYRGLLANLLKVAPAVSISYIVYENARILFGADMS